MSDYNSLTLRVTLSEDGATPLLFMEVYLKSDHHGNQTSNVSTDSVLLQPGNDVDVVVGNLEEGTEYSVGVAIYNYGGRGPTSQSTRGKTCELGELKLAWGNHVTIEKHLTYSLCEVKCLLYIFHYVFIRLII